MAQALRVTPVEKTAAPAAEKQEHQQNKNNNCGLADPGFSSLVHSVSLKSVLVHASAGGRTVSAL